MGRPAIKYALNDEVHDLKEFVDAKCCRGDPLRKMFALLTVDTPIVEMLKMRKCFYGKPERHVRAMMNGWRPMPLRPAVENLVGIAAEQYPHRILQINDTDGGHTMFVCDWMRGANVEVNIREGTTFVEAMDGLLRITAYMQQHWPRLIDQPSMWEVVNGARDAVWLDDRNKNGGSEPRGASQLCRHGSKTKVANTAA